MPDILTTIIYFLFSYGLTAILIYSDLAKPIRDRVTTNKFIRKMWNCSMCLGFWVGLFSFLLFFKFNIYLNFVFAVASSGVTWLLCSITQFALWGKVYYERKISSGTATEKELYE